MERKIKRLKQSARTIEQVFDDFVIAQTANGLSEVTLRNYKLLPYLFGQKDKTIYETNNPRPREGTEDYLPMED